MTATAIVCTAIAGAGILMILISIPLFLRKKTVIGKCTAETEGTVVKYRYGGGDGAHSVSPVAEYEVDGRKYKAYRHYRGVSRRKKRADTPFNEFSGGTEFVISEKDLFCITNSSNIINYNSFKENILWAVRCL